MRDVEIEAFRHSTTVQSGSALECLSWSGRRGGELSYEEGCVVRRAFRTRSLAVDAKLATEDSHL